MCVKQWLGYISEYQLTDIGTDIFPLLWMGSKAMNWPVEPLSMSNMKQAFPETRTDSGVLIVHAVNKSCFFFPTT